MSSNTSIEFIGIFLTFFVIYLIAFGIRRSQGIDLSLSFREVPPE